MFSTMDKKTIFITGATGFVGQHLCSRLTKNFTIHNVSLRNRNIKHLNVGHLDVFINLIGKAHDQNNTATEQEFYYANVELAKDIFSTFVNSSATLLVHISSIAAVEELESMSPLLETTLCRPNSWYGKTKQAAEEWLLSQELPKGKKLIILRPPMIHGQGDKGNLLLLYKLISKGVPNFLGAFDNARSFISIQNLCFLIERILQQEERISSGIYHIADDEPLSTNNIVKIIRDVTGIKTINLPFPKFLLYGIAKIGDLLPIPLNTTRLNKMTGTLIVSNQKIKSTLGIEKLPLTAEEGLRLTIESFKQNKV